jgi:hypothetical protein
LGCFGGIGGSGLSALGGLLCAGSRFGRFTRGRFGLYGRFLSSGGGGDSAGRNRGCLVCGHRIPLGGTPVRK